MIGFHFHSPALLSLFCESVKAHADYFTVSENNPDMIRKARNWCSSYPKDNRLAVIIFESPASLAAFLDLYDPKYLQDKKVLLYARESDCISLNIPCMDIETADDGRKIPQKLSILLPEHWLKLIKSMDNGLTEKNVLYAKSLTSQSVADLDPNQLSPDAFLIQERGNVTDGKAEAQEIDAALENKRNKAAVSLKKPSPSGDNPVSCSTRNQHPEEKSMGISFNPQNGAPAFPNFNPSGQGTPPPVPPQPQAPAPQAAPAFPQNHAPITPPASAPQAGAPSMPPFSPQAPAQTPSAPQGNAAPGAPGQPQTPFPGAFPSPQGMVPPAPPASAPQTPPAPAEPAQEAAKPAPASQPSSVFPDFAPKMASDPAQPQPAAPSETMPPFMQSQPAPQAPPLNTATPTATPTAAPADANVETVAEAALSVEQEVPMAPPPNTAKKQSKKAQKAEQPEPVMHEEPEAFDGYVEVEVKPDVELNFLEIRGKIGEAITQISSGLHLFEEVLVTLTSNIHQLNKESVVKTGAKYTAKVSPVSSEPAQEKKPASRKRTPKKQADEPKPEAQAAPTPPPASAPQAQPAPAQPPAEFPIMGAVFNQTIGNLPGETQLAYARTLVAFMLGGIAESDLTAYEQQLGLPLDNQCHAFAVSPHRKALAQAYNLVKSDVDFNQACSSTHARPDDLGLLLQIMPMNASPNA